MRPSPVEATRTPDALRFAFTQRDSPSLRARIERDLATIVEAARAADPHLGSILLLGGYSRGEGTATRGGPVNDYDLVAVRRRPRPPRHLYPQLAEDLSERVRLAVDLAPVWEARLRLAPRSIFWYEAREAGRVLWGRDPREEIRRVAAADLPPAEGVRLLFNRAVGLLVAAEEEPDPWLTTLQSVKAHLACGEALLVVSRRYHWSLRERLRRVADLTLPEGLEHVRAAVEDATSWKLSVEARSDADPGHRWDGARDDLVDVLGLVLGRSGRTLARELRQEPLASRLVWVARARRLGPSAPRARLRAACLQLLAACDGAKPREGPAVDRARDLLAPFGATPRDGFAALKAKLLAAREMTLT